MRKFYYVFIALALLSIEVNAQMFNSEKEVDNSEYFVTQKAASISASIDGTEDTYNRVIGSPYSGSCGVAVSTSGVGTAVFYDVYEIETTVSEAADISISSDGLGDSFMSLYCSFDPMNPTQNLFCADDDGAGGLMSAFTPGDGYMLTANTSYFLVVTTFGNGETGGYTLNMGGNLGFVTPAPPVPLSNWAFALIGLFAVTFVFIKFRK